MTSIIGVTNSRYKHYKNTNERDSWVAQWDRRFNSLQCLINFVGMKAPSWPHWSLGLLLTTILRNKLALDI